MCFIIQFNETTFSSAEIYFALFIARSGTAKSWRLQARKLKLDGFIDAAMEAPKMQFENSSLSSPQKTTGEVAQFGGKL